ncbi:MAG: hypothetical protein CL489_09065 [Acidobacteria bacterium]|nr:hypothetical protein [Acidobacteriota bacterium]|tara:strand:- start:23911 stop:24123 length:213 start_codon:yes stop_codon:yes gene_type:complete
MKGFKDFISEKSNSSEWVAYDDDTAKAIKIFKSERAAKMWLKNEGLGSIMRRQEFDRTYSSIKDRYDGIK